MSEHQVRRIAQLEEKNAALLEALENIQRISSRPYPISNGWLNEFVNAAIRKAK